MADRSRIEELRRRVQLDPASIAFAALAEEYRRAGQFEDAISTCLAGLQRHPAYLSARVTLGRSLLELGRFDEAREQLEHVLRVAPENLAAIRGLAEIHHRVGDVAEHPPADGHVEQGAAVKPVAHATTPVPQPVEATQAAEPPAPPPAAAPLRPVPVQLSKLPAEAAESMVPAPGAAEPASSSPIPLAPSRTPAAPPSATAPPTTARTPVPVPQAAPRRTPHPEDAALPALEAFLAAILRARETAAPSRPARR